MNHTIDATNKPLGRLASQVAALLNAKDSTLIKADVTNGEIKYLNA